MTRSIELSIVSPVFNGIDTIEEYILRTEKALETLNKPYQIILIDDGSTDESLSLMRKLQIKHPRVIIIKLTKNSGQLNAIAAGFTKAMGNYIAVMDSDLQDKPEDIILLYNKIKQESTDMVIATRQQINRPAWRNLGSISFYFLTNILTRLKFPCGSGVFRIMKRNCLDSLNEALQTPGTVLSFIHASGYTWKTIPLPREERKLMKSNYTFGKMLRLAQCRILPYCRLSFKWLGSNFLKRYIPEFSIDDIYTGEQNE
jgi:polyisoprenyl-phosphate glycosyltransferase